MSDSKLEHTNNQELVRLKNFFLYVRKYNYFVFASIIFGCVLGVIYSSIKKPVYTATLTFTLQEENKMGGGGGLLSLASSFGLDVGAGSGLFSGDNIEQVFKSRKILEKTLYQNYPNTNLTYGDFLVDILKIKVPYKKDNSFIKQNNSSRLKDSLISEIYKYLGKGYLAINKPDKKYDIYEASVKCTNEEFSLNFVQQLINQVSIFYTETKIKKLKSNVDVLQGRVDSIHRALGGSLFKRAESTILNLNPVFQTGKVPEQLTSIDVNALGTGYGELLKNLELAKYSLLKETPLFQIVDEPKMPLHKKEYSKYFYASLGSFLFFIFSIGILICIRILKSFAEMFKKN